MTSPDEATSNLTVRGIPARVRAKLLDRARVRRQSLNAYLLDVLSHEADTPTMEDVLADIDSVRRPTGLTTEDAVAAVRSVREGEDARWG